MHLDRKKIFKVCLAIFLLFLCVFYWQSFVGFVKTLVKASRPLIIGAFIAFVVNILMTKYEELFFPKKKEGFVAKIRRPVSIILAFLTALGLFAAIVWLIVPQLISCIQVIIAFLLKLPVTIKEFIAKADNWKFIPESLIEKLSVIDWESKIAQLVTWLSTGVGSAVNTLAKTLLGVVSGVITLVLGIIFSIYLLVDKDRLKSQFVRISVNYTPSKFYNKLFYVLRVFNENFKKFIIGQFTEAVILGVLCTLCMLILRMPYATMIGALIAFTALIPIAGAYIGAVTGALMILTISPAKALAFIIFIIILQQFEGNIIYPRVVGSSIGLPGIWVLAAVTIGGGCFGIFGMLIGVPLVSALYRILREDMIKRETVLHEEA